MKTNFVQIVLIATALAFGLPDAAPAADQPEKPEAMNQKTKEAPAETMKLKPLAPGPVTGSEVLELTAQAVEPEKATQETSMYDKPIRPGVPGERPFWNKHAREFMYAPAFDFPALKEAAAYRFTAKTTDGQDQMFTAPIPWAPLSPIWRKLPVGFVDLRVEALDSTGKVLKEVGNKRFWRAKEFPGLSAFPGPKKTYEQTIRDALVHLRKEKIWGDVAGCEVWGFISVAWMNLYYAKLRPAPTDADDALQTAQKAIHHMIGNSMAEGKAWQYHPRTFTNNDRELIADRGAMAAMAYLDLYDETKNDAIFQAALKIADTYKDRQLTNGTWHARVTSADGNRAGDVFGTTPSGDVFCCPAVIIEFLQRLKTQYKVDRFEAVKEKSVQWMFSPEGPMADYARWTAQFEDMRVEEDNLSSMEAARFATYLFENSSKDPSYAAQAEELLAWCEDQFVFWGLPQPMNRLGKPTAAYQIPSVLEQYKGYPVDNSCAYTLRAFAAAYAATGKEIYLHKANALADAFTRFQEPDGRIPTFADPNFPFSPKWWFNCQTADIVALWRFNAKQKTPPLEASGGKADVITK